MEIPTCSKRCKVLRALSPASMSRQVRSVFKTAQLPELPLPSTAREIIKLGFRIARSLGIAIQFQVRKS